MFKLVFMWCNERLNLKCFSNKFYKIWQHFNLQCLNLSSINLSEGYRWSVDSFSHVYGDTVITFNHKSHHTRQSHKDHPPLPSPPPSLGNSALYKRLQRKIKWKLISSVIIRNGRIPKTKVLKPWEQCTFGRLFFFLLVPRRGRWRWGIF